MGYKYYDTPEGQDVGKKLFVTCKYATLIGFGASTADVLMHSHPKGYVQTLARYAIITGPLVGMAAAFTTATAAATSFRKKDDKLNYVIGACASSAVLGGAARSPLVGGLACIFLSLAAVAKKSSIQDGWKFFPEPSRRVSGSLWSSRHDLSLTADRPGNWTTK